MPNFLKRPTAPPIVGSGYGPYLRTPGARGFADPGVRGFSRGELAEKKRFRDYQPEGALKGTIFDFIPDAVQTSAYLQDRFGGQQEPAPVEDSFDMLKMFMELTPEEKMMVAGPNFNEMSEDEVAMAMYDFIAEGRSLTGGREVDYMDPEKQELPLFMEEQETPQETWDNFMDRPNYATGGMARSPLMKRPLVRPQRPPGVFIGEGDNPRFNIPAPAPDLTSARIPFQMNQEPRLAGNIPGFGDVFSIPGPGSGTSNYVDASGNSIPKDITSEWGRGRHGELMMPQEYKTPPTQSPYPVPPAPSLPSTIPFDRPSKAPIGPSDRPSASPGVPVGVPVGRPPIPPRIAGPAIASDLGGGMGQAPKDPNWVRDPNMGTLNATTPPGVLGEVAQFRTPSTPPGRPFDRPPEMAPLGLSSGLSDKPVGPGPRSMFGPSMGGWNLPGRIPGGQPIRIPEPVGPMPGMPPLTPMPQTPMSSPVIPRLAQNTGEVIAPARTREEKAQDLIKRFGPEKAEEILKKSGYYDTPSPVPEAVPLSIEEKRNWGRQPTMQERLEKAMREGKFIGPDDPNYPPPIDFVGGRPPGLPANQPWPPTEGPDPFNDAVNEMPGMPLPRFEGDNPRWNIPAPGDPMPPMPPTPPLEEEPFPAPGGYDPLETVGVQPPITPIPEPPIPPDVSPVGSDQPAQPTKEEFMERLMQMIQALQERSQPAPQAAPQAAPPQQWAPPSPRPPVAAFNMGNASAPMAAPTMPQMFNSGSGFFTPQQRGPIIDPGAIPQQQIPMSGGSPYKLDFSSFLRNR